MPKPEQPPALPTQAHCEGDITQVRRYKVITPIFGGGVEAGRHDPITPVRGSAVRGHLRFWWRACRAGSFAGPTGIADMRNREGEIWGLASTRAASRASALGLQVVTTNRGEPQRPHLTPGNPLTYGAFPIAESDEPLTLLHDVEFELRLQYPSAFATEVAAALWAWETFGGIGGRTRRGFGAIVCIEVDGQTAMHPPSDGDGAQAWLIHQLKSHVVGQGESPGVPRLAMDVANYRFREMAQNTTAEDCQRDLLGRLKAFRQDRNPNNNGPYGTSRWPEANVIRRRANRNHPNHVPGLRPTDLFPRAEFGLPIEFKFNDRDVRLGDPDKTYLKGATKDHDRLASRLILRPVACASGAILGLAAILEPHSLRQLPGGMVLENEPHPKRNNPPRATLTAAEARAIPRLSGNTDVLRAFLNFL